MKIRIVFNLTGLLILFILPSDNQGKAHISMPKIKKDSTLIPELPRQRSSGEIVFKREPLSNKDFTKIVRKMRLKVTHQRLSILKTLHLGQQHMTAQAIFEEVRATFPGIGFATVYRFLKNLSQHSLVTELRMGGLPTRYELTPDNHHDHITCTSCGTIIEFENSEIEKLQIQVATKLGFSLKHHVLELYGQCQACSQNELNIP